MNNKKHILYAAISWVIVVFGVALLIGAWVQNGEAFYGKCYTRDGAINVLCANQNQKRNIYTTYAKNLPTYFRRSRSGNNWRNHQNKEATQATRNKYQTRYYRSSILQRYYRPTRSTAAIYRNVDATLQQYNNRKRKQTRAETKAQEAKFEIATLLFKSQ